MTGTQIQRALDRDRLRATLLALARVPNAVEPGFDTLLAPDHPKLVHYVQRVMRPRLEAIGVGDIVEADGGGLIVRAGDGTLDRSLLIQSYAVAQHHNLMERPFEPRLRPGPSGGTALYAQGVSQTKAHQAVMLAVLDMLRALGVRLRGRLYWTLNCEGRSSHACTEAILAALDRRPDFGLLQTPRRMRLSLGNRGRVDVEVRLTGAVAHSSTPAAGASAIPAAAEAIARLQRLRWDDVHPRLGARQAIVYKVDFEPKLPHTLPALARLTVDRRLLPGDDPDDAAREVRAALGDLPPYDVQVTRGVTMLPALVDAAEPHVRALQGAVAAVRGTEAVEEYAAGTFDAGGLCRHGIPAVMYGAGGGGDWPTGDDFVELADVEDEARILATLILDTLA